MSDSLPLSIKQAQQTLQQSQVYLGGLRLSPELLKKIHGAYAQEKFPASLKATQTPSEEQRLLQYQKLTQRV